MGSTGDMQIPRSQWPDATVRASRLGTLRRTGKGTRHVPRAVLWYGVTWYLSLVLGGTPLWQGSPYLTGSGRNPTAPWILHRWGCIVSLVWASRALCGAAGPALRLSPVCTAASRPHHAAVLCHSHMHGQSSYHNSSLSGYKLSSFPFWHAIVCLDRPGE